MYIPVEIMIGFPALAIVCINGISIFSKEAILNTVTSRLFRKSKAVISNGVEKKSSSKD